MNTKPTLMTFAAIALAATMVAPGASAVVVQATHHQTAGGTPVFGSLWGCIVVSCSNLLEDSTDHLSLNTPTYLVAARIMYAGTAACGDGIYRPGLCQPGGADNQAYFYGRGTQAPLTGAFPAICILADGDPGATGFPNNDGGSGAVDFGMTYSVWQNVPFVQNGVMFANGGTTTSSGPYFVSDFLVIGTGTDVNFQVNIYNPNTTACNSWFDADAGADVDAGETTSITPTNGNSDWVTLHLVY
ncbi:MAG: hypothetical protein V4510_10330 [bacterium]